MSPAPEDRCDERIRELYGDGLRTPPGVLHVASAWCDPAGRLFTLRIGPRAPRSATDSFALSVARARVDAIVTTGQILRDEPALTNAVRDPDLLAWRRAVLGRAAAPLTIVLSRGGGLPRSHPLLADAVVLARGLREALAWLRDERRIRSVAVEAGPSTSAALYEEPLAVDELMLSLCRAVELPPGVRGGELPPLAELDRRFTRVSECTREEESGPWTFLRFRS